MAPVLLLTCALALGAGPPAPKRRPPPGQSQPAPEPPVATTTAPPPIKGLRLRGGFQTGPFPVGDGTWENGFTARATYFPLDWLGVSLAGEGAWVELSPALGGRSQRGSLLGGLELRTSLLSWLEVGMVAEAGWALLAFERGGGDDTVFTAQGVFDATAFLTPTIGLYLSGRAAMFVLTRNEHEVVRVQPALAGGVVFRVR